MEKGLVVYSLAGHDKGNFQVVIRCEGNRVFVCDGKNRTLEKPKSKNIVHLKATRTVLKNFDLQSNKSIRVFLRQFREKVVN